MSNLQDIEERVERQEELYKIVAKNKSEQNPAPEGYDGVEFGEGSVWFVIEG